MTTDITRPTNPGPLDAIDNSAFHPDSDIEAFRVPRDTTGAVDE
jgi:hypothetical protein